METTMRHVYIINPAAGRDDATAALIEQIERAYADIDDGLTVSSYITQACGDATRYVRQFCEQHPDEPVRFYACGGDGTLNEVVNGAVGYPQAAVGLIPSGTGNDFVRNFTPLEQFRNLNAQRVGREIEIDLLRCNDTYCVNMINAGFDCEVVVKMAEIKRKPYVPAGMAYILGVALTLLRKPGVLTTVTVDGVPQPTRKLLLCAVGNGAFYGGGFHPVPGARPNDGKLDACMVDDISRVRFLGLVGDYKKGTHIKPETEDILRCMRCESVNLQFPQPWHVSLDGEVCTMEHCQISVVPRALRFVLPQDAAVVGGETEQLEQEAIPL